MRYLDPTNDLTFRKIFGDEKRQDSLISLLNAVLGLTGLTWIARIPGTSMRGTAMQQFISKWAEKDPTAAENAALALTDSVLRGAALRAVAERKANDDPAAAWAWAQQLSGAGSGEAVAAALWRRLGSIAPHDAAAELATFRSSGSSADIQVLTRGFVENWARTDPQAAASWASQLPSNEQSTAYEGLLKAWANHDAAAASEWLSKLPQGPQQDAAIATFARELKSDDPSSALSWAATISDAVTRFAAIQAILPTDGAQRNLRLLMLENPALTAEDRTRLGR